MCVCVRVSVFLLIVWICCYSASKTVKILLEKLVAIQIMSFEIVKVKQRSV